MCGLAVAISWDNADQIVGQLIGGLLHRGDVTDPLVSPLPRTAMCTRRLRVVDADHGVQPGVSFDYRILVALNGEIYNHLDLRRELEARGVVFRTGSDTEVLASALSLWGEGALERINGMYAFVAIDLDTGEFLAARDPVGVKPLYLIRSPTGFLFCSEMRPLLAAAESGDVLVLPPGHLLTRNRFAQFKSFIAHGPRDLGPHDPEILDRLLAAAVHTRLPPDLPAAMMFSGGVDSTLIAHYARRIRPDTPGYFLGDASAPDYAYASRYADQTGLNLRCVALDDIGDDVGGTIRETVRVVETFQAGVVRDSFCTSLLARRIHQDGFRVVLAGEGADELFAGYAPLEQAFSDGDLFGNFVRDQCLGTMHKTNLQRLDRSGMRFQVETRHPFLDPSVIDYALGLKASDLVRDVEGRPRGKEALRSLFGLHPEQLPDLIRDRRKIPLSEGAGFDRGDDDARWTAFAEDAISDRQLAEGLRQFEPFGVESKEELFYLEALAATLDVWRVPHLTAERRLLVPSRP